MNNRKTWIAIGSVFAGCTALWLNDLAQHGWILTECAKDYSGFFAAVGTALHLIEQHDPDSVLPQIPLSLQKQFHEAYDQFRADEKK